MRARAWLALACLLGCQTPASPELGDLAEEADVISDTRTPSQPTPSFVCLVVPESEVIIRAPAKGEVERFDVRVGDFVDRDTELVRFDRRAAQRAQAIAAAEVAGADANLELSKLSGTHAKHVVDDLESLQGTIPAAEIRNARHQNQLARAKIKQAKATVRASQARLSESNAQVRDKTVSAPFAGTVAERFVDSGATLSDRAPLLRLVSHRRRIRFAVPRQHVAQVGVGEPVSIALDVSEDILPGHIVSLSPELEAASNLVLVEAVFSGEPDPTPLVGTSGRVWLSPAP